MTSRRKRDVAIDIQRIFAILMVVVGHSLWFSNLKYNQTAQLIFHFFYIAVPLFFYLSGYSLGFNFQSRKEQPLGAMLHGTSRKLLIPLLIWSLIYAIWTIIFYRLYSIAYNTEVHANALVLLTTKFRGFHLWFIVSLIIFYMIFWYLCQNQRYKHNRYLIYALGITLLFTSLQYLEYFLSWLIILQYTPIPYLFFFVAGFWSYLNRETLDTLSRQSIPYQVTAAMFCITGLGLIIIETLYSPLGISNVRFSIFIFATGVILLQGIISANYPFKKDNISTSDSPTSPTSSTGSKKSGILQLVHAIPMVYFIHIIILDILTLGFIFLGFSVTHLLTILVIAILNPLLSFSITIGLTDLRQ